MASGTLFRATLERVPFLVLGAAGGWMLSGWNERVSHARLSSILIGAGVGLWLYPDFRGLLKACRTGAVRWLLVWTVVGATAGGGLGLLVKWLSGDAAATVYAWLLGGDWLMTSSRWAMLGALLALWQSGSCFDSRIQNSSSSGGSA